MKPRFLALATAFLVLAPAAHAYAAPEQGDAGELPSSAQNLTGEAVGTISGRLDGPEPGDLYRICLSGGGSFSATTEGATEIDTQLFLFNGAGRGVYANDDWSGTKQATLPADNPLTPTTPGEYFLGVSSYGSDPYSAEGIIFPNVAYLVGATGRGAGAPLERWDGRPREAGDYTVTLTGTTVCDSTAPAIDLRSPSDGVQVPLGARVEVDFSCTDEGGSGLASCEGTVADGATLDTSTLGTKSVTVTALDRAGNQSVVTASVEVTDQTAPVIDLRTPAEGAVYTVGGEVTVDYDCADQPAGSGLATCTGDLADGARLDTSSPGTRTFTVTSGDSAGNTTAETVSYEVAAAGHEFEGFLWPVEAFPGVTRWVAGVPVPIRFSLGGDQGRDVLADGYPQVAEVDCGAGETPEQGAPARSAWGQGLRYRPRKDRYVYLWKTEHRWAGSCRQFLLRLDDGSLQRAEFKFPRRWWWR